MIPKKRKRAQGTRARRLGGRNIYQISQELGNALGYFIEVRESAEIAVSHIENLIDELAPYIEIQENRKVAGME